MIKYRLQRRGKRPPLHVHQCISQFTEAVVWPASRNRRKKPKKLAYRQSLPPLMEIHRCQFDSSWWRSAVVHVSTVDNDPPQTSPLLGIRRYWDASCPPLLGRERPSTTGAWTAPAADSERHECEERERRALHVRRKKGVAGGWEWERGLW